MLTGCFFFSILFIMTTQTHKLTRIMHYEYQPMALIAKRKELGLTPEQVGEKTGLHGVTIRRIEHGQNADYSSVARYCELFEIPLSAVILNQVETGIQRGARKKCARQLT